MINYRPMYRCIGLAVLRDRCVDNDIVLVERFVLALLK